MAARTRQAFDDKKNPGLLTITAISELKGVDIMAGLLKIESIVTSSVHKVDGRTVKSHKDTVVVGGVTVGGMPATISEQGVSVNGAGQGKPAIDALNAALQQALEAANAKIYLLGATKPAPYGNDQPCGEGSAGGVQFYTEQDLTQVPQQGGVFFANITLGQACTAAAASAARVTAEGTDDQSGIVIGGGGTGGGGAAEPGPTSGGAATAVDAGSPRARRLRARARQAAAALRGPGHSRAPAGSRSSASFVARS